MTALLAILFGVFLAYANGANDNFKGVATLFGSGTTDYKRALVWGTAATFFGSLAALILAQGLLAAFSGKGLVPDNVVAMKSFSIAVVLASALTVMLATRFGFPISTTHSVTGALAGAGWLASSSGVNFEKLGSSFLVPLIASPVAAIAFAAIVYPIFSMVRAKLGVKRETCVCIGAEVIATVPQGTAPKAAHAILTLSVGTEATCQERYSGRLLGVNARAALDFAHFLSAGMVSFARGLNDTPKLAALLLAGGTLSPAFTIITVAVAMAMGGLLGARRVAETMSHRVTTMNAGQGFTANLVTSCIVISASGLGLPVSTTHVSCGALFGMGAVTRQANWKSIAAILVAWITTFPVAGILGAALFLMLKGVFV